MSVLLFLGVQQLLLLHLLAVLTKDCVVVDRWTKAHDLLVQIPFTQKDLEHVVSDSSILLRSVLSIHVLLFVTYSNTLVIYYHGHNHSIIL